MAVEVTVTPGLHFALGVKIFDAPDGDQTTLTVGELLQLVGGDAKDGQREILADEIRSEGNAPRQNIGDTGQDRRFHNRGFFYGNGAGVFRAVLRGEGAVEGIVQSAVCQISADLYRDRPVVKPGLHRQTRGSGIAIVHARRRIGTAEGWGDVDLPFVAAVLGAGVAVFYGGRLDEVTFDDVPLGVGQHDVFVAFGL